MKKPIKIIAAIVAFVFATEQIVYPAPYSGQWSGGSFTLRPAASRAAIPAGDPQAFFGEPLVATTTLLLEEERTLNAMLAQESLPPAIRTEIERLRDRLYAAKLDPTAADKPAQKAIAISDRQDGLAIASGTEEPVAQDKPADPASADATSESWQAIITTVREFLRKRRVSRAIEQLIEGKTEEALVAFGRAIRVDPQHADRIAEDIISKTRDEKQPLEGITGPLIEVLKNKATPTHERVISAWLLGEIGCIGPDKARKDVRTPLKRRRYGETLSKYPNYLLLWAIAGSLNKMKAEVKPPEKARWNPSQRQEEILQILKDIFDKGNKELKDKLKSERYKVEIIAAPGDSALASGRYFDGIEPLHIYVCCPSMSDSEVKELNKAKGRWQAAIEEIRCF